MQDCHPVVQAKSQQVKSQSKRIVPTVATSLIGVCTAYISSGSSRSSRSSQRFRISSLFIIALVVPGELNCPTSYAKSNNFRDP